MKKNIRLVTFDCCEDLLRFSKNKEARSYYNGNSFPQKGLKFLETKTGYSIEENLKLRATPKEDFANSKIIFNAFKDLDRVQANDKRLWVMLTHTVCFEYTVKRWSIDKGTSDDTIISRFHFEGAGIEGRMRNAISRLWWSAKLTYDQDREDPFELTELLWEKQDIITSLVERSFGTYPNILHGFLEFYKMNRRLKEDEIRALAKGLNALGGVKILPLLDRKTLLSEIQKIAKYNGIKAR